jgi:hypothetical protein
VSATRLAARPELHALALVALALAAWLPFGITRTPMEGDRGYFTYYGQVVLRGDSIYAIDFLGYPPIGPLLSAAAMAAGRPFGVPTYLAPRYAALGVALLCVVGVQLVTRRATRSAWAGLAAGVAMLGFERWAWSAFATLEPKHLVMLFSLAASLALQARRPFAAGLAGALAVGCYHPAGVVVVPALAATLLWDWRSAPRRPLLCFALGGLVGTLPTIAYLTAHHAFAAWWVRAVSIPASHELRDAGFSFARLLRLSSAQFSGDLPLFLLGGVGLAFFAAGCLRRPRDVGETWLAARSGAMPLLGVTWLVWSLWTFGWAGDLFLLLPYVAFWNGWALASPLRAAGRLRPPTHALASGLLLAAFARVALVPSADFLHRDHREMRSERLARQLHNAERIAALTGPAGLLVALSAEEFYALREVPSPVPFLRLQTAFLPHLRVVGYAGCGEALAAILALEPRAIAIQLFDHVSDCERGAEGFFGAHGYRRAFAERRLVVLAPVGRPPP